MNKRIFDVVGVSSKIDSAVPEKSFSVLHLLGDQPFFKMDGFEVCKAFVGLNEYKVGDKVIVMYIRSRYIVLGLA